MPRAGKKLSPDAAMPAISEDAKENFPPNEEDTVVNQEISSEDVTEKVPEETTTVPDETASKRSASFGSRSSQQMIKKRRTMSNRAGNKTIILKCLKLYFVFTAGLTFPVYRILKHLKKGRYAKIIQKGKYFDETSNLTLLSFDMIFLRCCCVSCRWFGILGSRSCRAWL